MTEAPAGTETLIQVYLGVLEDTIVEKCLEDIAFHCHTDFALELRNGKLLLFTVGRKVRS